MLVTSTTDTSSSSGTPSRTPSILDSPILARVERARLRLEASSSSNQQTQQNNYYQNRNSVRDDSLERSITDPKQSLLAGRIPIGAMTGPIKRGLLWQQRDRLFSRWKERYFVLTRDYLHCFKRASGSANERASDMGQFIFKVKLVDVEKVEWLNRRSYSAIGLVLGREGRVLLRSDDGLEDWFELLEECTLTSKERRHALKITQSPRSRASLAAPISHASLQANHFGLGGTYSSALDDWLMTHNGGSGGGVANGTNTGRHHLFSDSVPDLSSLNNENHSGLSTNHSTPQKTSSGNSFNVSRSSHGYASQNNSFFNGLYGSPRRIFINSFKMSQAVDEEELDDGEVELRRSGSRGFCNNNAENGNDMDGGSSGGGNGGGGESLYRKPRAPTDMRHSVQTDWDYIANDSGFNTPQSTTPRPSSYRDMSHNNSSHHSMETSLSSTRSPCGSFRNVIGGGGSGSGRGVKHSNQASAVVIAASSSSSSSSRYYLPERVLKIRNEEDFSASMLKVQNFRNNNNNNANTSNNNNNSSSNNNNSEQMSIRV